MANVEDESTPVPHTTRSGAALPGTLKVRPRDDDDQLDPDEFSRLLGVYDNSFRNIAEGEVVEGTVLKSRPPVIVDVGYKSEGIIAISEFLDENGEVTVRRRPGGRPARTHRGPRRLRRPSREKAEKMKIWDEVEKAYAERKVVIGRVIERIKGGLRSTSASARSSGSQIDVRPVRNLDALRGQGCACG
jgi:small subunit ribosomal protein S1